MKNIDELKLNIYNSFDKYKINESNFSECTINIDKNQKDEVDSFFDYEIPTHSWKDFNSNPSKSISEWHNRRCSEFFDETEDYEDYFTLLWTHPIKLLNLSILHESYADFLKLTDEVVKTRSTDLPKTLKFHLDSSFDEEQLFLYNSIAHYIAAIIQETEPLFERMKKDYPKFNQDHALDNLKKVFEDILCCMLDNAEVGKHDFYDIIIVFYNDLNSVKYDTSNILDKFKDSNEKLYKPKDLDLMYVVYYDEDKSAEQEREREFLKSYDLNKQQSYVRYITNSIKWGIFDKQSNEIYTLLIEKISEDDYNQIKLKIEFYLTLAKFNIVEGESPYADWGLYTHVMPLYHKMIDPEDGKTDIVYINGKHLRMNSFEKSRREVLIKMLEFNLDTFIDCLKGTYYFSEKPPDYFYNVLDALGALRNDEEFPVFSAKVIKTLHLNYELMVKYDFSNRQQKKIIGLSDHDFNFSLNIFVLYYQNEYKINTAFSDFIARNNSKDVKSYLDFMSMTETEWANSFMDGFEEVYKEFSSERSILDYDFYNENYELDIDTLINNTQNPEHQYIAPSIIYYKELQDDSFIENAYKLEYEKDDLDVGYAIVDQELVDAESLELKNSTIDTFSIEYIHDKIYNHISSHESLFNSTFLTNFYILIIKHYLKEGNKDSQTKATKDVIKLSKSINLSDRNIYDISLLFIHTNDFKNALDFIKKITDSDFKDTIIDLFCSKHSVKEIINLAQSFDRISSKKFIERLIVSNREFSDDEYFLLSKNASCYPMQLNYLLSSQKSKRLSLSEGEK